MNYLRKFIKMIFSLSGFKLFLIPVKFFMLLLYFLISMEIQAQPKNNLDIFYSLVDSSANNFISHIPGSKDSVKLDLNLGDSFSIFGNKIISNLFASGKIITEENKNVIKINFVIDNAKVEYGEIYRDGFFGDYYIPRTITLKGNYLVYGSPANFKEFAFSYNDSIRYDEINSVENESYPFTKGDIPSEPFFSGLFEPVVAIGTAALAVILFFTIRSK